MAIGLQRGSVHDSVSVYIAEPIQLTDMGKEWDSWLLAVFKEMFFTAHP